jgi:hypothetical protein
LRRDAATLGVGDDVVVEVGMKEKAAEFVAGGSQLYR